MINLYGQELTRGSATLSVMLSPLLYYLIVWSSVCTCALGSTTFVKYTDRKFICRPDPVPLRLSPGWGNNLACARQCQRQLHCIAFMFTPHNTISQNTATGARPGTCLWCPASTIVNISFTATDPLLETWINVLGYLVQPKNRELFAIPGALSVGRIVILQGRVPDPVLHSSQFTLYINNSENVAVGISPRFLSHKNFKRVAILTRINGEWKEEYLWPKGFFPFPPGGKIEFAVLATGEGFRVYINGDFTVTVTSTAHWLDEVGYAAVRNINEALVTF
ncbi:hypothetical protein PoB_000416800 [Plakobranchus ocellatus]|uniref:Galectin n=1 Tax=Plakobranchus ocellatus TaxID=259542 RepID=A0AAV3Y660_9GAST|nr:hypothetical protein PoB_000416800 [Plakobranchus ocellatus]